MYDMLEGVIPRVIYELLSHCIRKKYFSLQKLNHIIANFKYGYSEASDKPWPIEMIHLKNKRLRQTSVQTWLLATSLPFMVGVRVRQSDSKWKCLTIVLEISRIVWNWNWKATFRVHRSDLEAGKLSTTDEMLKTCRYCLKTACPVLNQSTYLSKFYTIISRIICLC